MITYCGGSHDMKYFIERSHSTRQRNSHICFLQHDILTVTQIDSTKRHIKQIADSPPFFQLGRNYSHYHSSIFFCRAGNSLHKSCIRTSINEPLSGFTNPCTQFGSFFGINRIDVIGSRTEYCNFIHNTLIYIIPQTARNSQCSL